MVRKLKDKGMTVILAHPERYEIVKKEPQIIKDFINMGCLMQCNYASILGYYGNGAKKTMKELLKKNYVTFL